MATNYERGRAFEYARMAYWRKEGYSCMRTAGSHGLYDLVCIRAHTPVMLIQCKRCETLTQAKHLIGEFMYQVIPGIPAHQRIEIYVKATKKVETWSI